MKKFLFALMLALVPVLADAQVDRHDVRAGNRKFRKQDYKEAEIDYRKAVVKDSLSVAGQYNLASTLYREEDVQGAMKALDAVKEVAPMTPHAADYYYNLGDAALQAKDYKSAVMAFGQSLLLRPDDLDAKENYIYAKKMMQNQDQGGGGQDQDQNQDQNNDQNQDQDQNNQNGDQDQNDQSQDNQDQNNDQNQDQGDQDNRSQPQPQESKISPQQAQQMIQAIQSKEKETQDKVNKKKADLLQSKQREKNW